MVSKKHQQWAFIFETLGKENLRKMLFKIALHHDEEGRTVIEFDKDKAMNITEHVNEMEEKLTE